MSGLKSDRVFLFIVAAVALATVVLIYAKFATDQWDFASYYHAALVHNQGGDIYDLQQLKSISGNDNINPYLYPPATIYLFMPFTATGLHTAFYLYLTLKLICLFFLIAIWRRYFLYDIAGWKSYAVILLAFGSTVIFDLRTGNVSIFEQLMLWLGLSCLLRGRLGWFAVAVIGASVFKWTLAAFLILPVIMGLKDRWRHFAASAAAFLVTVGLSFALDPSGFKTFIVAASAHDERATASNYSIMALFRDAADLAAGVGLPEQLLWAGATAAFLAVVAVVVWMTLRELNPAELARGKIETREAILLACVSYALILPRLKAYSFIVLIPAVAYFIFKRYRWSAAIPLLVIVAITADPTYPIQAFSARFGGYFPILVTLTIFLTWIASLNAPTSVTGTPAPKGP